MESRSASEERRPSRLEFREREVRGVPWREARLREEWMSPRLFVGVAFTTGLLSFDVQYDA